MSKRIYYIDWLRVLAVLLLFPFHTWRVFDVEPFYVMGAESVPLAYVLGFISAWHMQLLFVLAGASTFFALRRRSGAQYLTERIKRLLVPFLFGWFFLVTPQTWIGAKFNAGYTDSLWSYVANGDFLVLNVREGGDYWGGFGLGHLWFILFLLVLSLVALPLFLWGRGEKGSAFMRKFCRTLAHPLGALLAAFVILVGDALPDLEGLNPFYYLAFFVLGYAAFCSTEFAESAERYRWPTLLLGTGLSVFWVATWEWRDALPDPSIERAVATYFGMLAAWLMIMGLIGWGRRYLDWTSDRLSYHAEASYPIYILHQTVIVILAWYVVRLAVAWQLQWTVLFLASIAVTFAAYEVVRRVSPLRFLFGMRPKAK